MKEAGCAGTILARIVITLLLYADDIIIMARCPSNIEKQLRILKYLCSSTSMTIKIGKTKVMIIKSKKRSLRISLHMTTIALRSNII